jgi:hypothetical protein
MSRKTKSLDEEEKDLIQEWEKALETGEAIEKPLSKKEKEEWRKAAASNDAFVFLADSA